MLRCRVALTRCADRFRDSIEDQQLNGTDQQRMIRRFRQSYGLAGILVLCLIVVSIAITVQLSVEAAEHETMSEDVMVSTWVQQASIPGVDYLVEFLNWIGRPIPLALLTSIFAVGLMSRRRYAEAILVLPATGTHAVNAIIKNIVQSPRPTEHEVRIQDHASGFGFPSGHTMAVVVFCGVVAYLAWRLIERRRYRYAVHALVALAVVGIGFSRIYSGAHWPSDVLGGYLWGTFYTGVLVLLFHRLQPLEATAEPVPTRITHTTTTAR
jgi:undecaprenyl-diphosphatase